MHLTVAGKDVPVSPSAKLRPALKSHAPSHQSTSIGLIKSTARDDAARDFMRVGYELIREPLNLCEEGQKWFTGVCTRELVPADHAGLVLGATPWLANLLQHSGRLVWIVDKSPAMLQLSLDTLSPLPGVPADRMHFVEGDWSDLSCVNDRLDAVLGDNSFNYLSFPDGWIHLCDELASRLVRGGRLITRMCSTPTAHRRQSPDQIIDRFMLADTINYTEVRAQLLFAHVDECTYTIDTEAVLDTFETNSIKFDRLFLRFPHSPDNDLLTVRKYRGAHAYYVAPPLTHILDVLRHRFTVTAVHFGPYAMSEYFPLISATVR